MDFTFSFSDREERIQKTLNARRLAFRIIVLAGLVAMFTTLPLLALSQSYSDFSSISGLVVNPVEPPNPMQVNGNVLRINSANLGQVGPLRLRIFQGTIEDWQGEIRGCGFPAQMSDFF